jgi:hypothetical protein
MMTAEPEVPESGAIRAQANRAEFQNPAAAALDVGAGLVGVGGGAAL